MSVFVCCCTFIADCTDASVEILKTDHTQTAGIQEPRQILHLKPQTNYSTYANRAEINMLSYIYWQQNTHILIHPQDKESKNVKLE